MSGGNVAGLTYIPQGGNVSKINIEQPGRSLRRGENMSNSGKIEEKRCKG